MNQPTECKHCGLHATWHIHEDTFFACGTTYAGRGDYWNQSTGCVEIMQSRGRVQRAVEVLEGARRICVGLCDEDGEDVESEHDGVIYVESTEADRAAAILLGNSSESPDSSPITTDDLATADYYEAVRQRVPWMVAVEHIEGLVEGYRRCGVMVWQAAEQIQRIYGGGYGKAD